MKMDTHFEDFPTKVSGIGDLEIARWIKQNFLKYDAVDNFYIYYNPWRLWKGEEILIERGKMMGGRRIELTPSEKRIFRKLIDNLEKESKV